MELMSLESMLKYVSKFSGGNLRPVDLTKVKFNFNPVVTESTITYMGDDFYISSKWVIKQLCKLIGISEKFYRNSPSSLLNDIFNTHILLVNKKQVESVLYFTDEGSKKTLKAILPKDFFNLTDYEVLNSLNLEYGADIKGFHVLDSNFKFNYVCVFSKEFKVGDDVYNKAIMVESSEVGACDLSIIAGTYNIETSFFLPMLINGKPTLKSSYCNPENGTLVPQLKSSIVAAVDSLEDGFPSVEPRYIEEIKDDEEAFGLLTDWETRKGVSKKFIKKCAENMTVMEDPCEKFGDVCKVLMETCSEYDYKIGLFISDQLSFFVSSQDEQN